MEACAVICGKAAVALPDANPLTSEHKIGIFVSELAIFPWFLPLSSTKSRFLCAFALRNPRFRAFRAQNRGFCALLGLRTPVFGHFEHKIEVFVRFWPSEPSFSGISSTKLGFLCQNGQFFPGFRASRAQNRGFCAFLAFGTPVFGYFEHKIGVFVRFAEGGEGGGVKLSFFV